MDGEEGGVSGGVVLDRKQAPWEKTGAGLCYFLKCLFQTWVCWMRCLGHAQSRGPSVSAPADCDHSYAVSRHFKCLSSPSNNNSFPSNGPSTPLWLLTERPGSTSICADPSYISFIAREGREIIISSEGTDSSDLLKGSYFLSCFLLFSLSPSLTTDHYLYLFIGKFELNLIWIKYHKLTS